MVQGIAMNSRGSVSHGSQLFNLLLQSIEHFTIPQRGTKEDLEFRSTLKLEDEDATFLALWFGRLLVLSIVKGSGNVLSPPGATCPGLRPDEYAFLTLQNKPETWVPSSPLGLNLAETKVRVAKLLTSGMFTDAERVLPALFASADPSSTLSSIGDDILKRTIPNISLEDPSFVKTLFALYFGDDGTNAMARVRVPLRMKLLGLLSKSTVSTTFTEEIIELANDGITTSLTDDDKAVLRPDYSNVSSASGREAMKLRGAIFVYINFVARYGTRDSLYKIGPRVLGRLREFIEGQGWPRVGSNEDLVSRGLAYEVIGLLAKSGPDSLVIEPNLDVLRWLFESLASETPASSVAVSVEEALSTLIAAFSKRIDEQTTGSLENLLIDQMEKSKAGAAGPERRSTAYVAVRFANRCLPYASVKARWVDLLAIGGLAGSRQEVSEEGRRGLSPYWHHMLNGAMDTSGIGNFPDFVDLVNHIFFQGASDTPAALTRESAANAAASLRNSYPKVYTEALKYCRYVFMQQALCDGPTQVKVDSDWEHKLDAAIENDVHIRDTLKKRIASVAVQDSRMSASFKLLLLAFSANLLSERHASTNEEANKFFIELCALSPGSLTAITADQYKHLLPAIFSNKLPVRQAAAQAFGILASQIDVGQHDPEGLSVVVNQLLAKSGTWRTAIGESMNQAHGSVIALGYLYSRIALRSNGRFTSEQTFIDYLKILTEITLESTDNLLREAAFTAIGELALFQVLTPTMFGEEQTLRTVIDKIADVAKTGNERAALSLGQIAMILNESESKDEAKELSLLILVEERLHKLHEIKQMEAQFSIGESLSYVASGWKSTALATKMDIDCATPQGPKRQGTLKRVLEKTLHDCQNTKPSLRKASVVWLLCLVQYCGHLEEVQSQLPSCQVAFKRCLSDRDELIQESASRGLGLVYEKGDRNLKNDLVKDLVGSFSDSKTQLTGNVTAETELFEPGALPTGDGSITTYKDIMSLASEVGDSSLVYRFMSMASSNAIWSSRAAFGRFGLSNVLSDSSVDGYLANNPKLYPKLYRYKFDPNSNVQRSMNDIWNALVKDSSATIEQHFDAIMEDLLLNILGKEWRVRQASCAAIADLVQGRALEKYEKYLERIWSLCFKVLDDIKESVRAAAGALARVMTGILTRSLEADTAASKNAVAMLKHVLPFLLSTSGLESSAQEVQGFALHTLLEIIKKGSGKTLRPFIPELVERLIGLLSSLEPQEVNYLHLNASKYNLTEQKIDNIRLSSIRSSPLMEAIERCLDLLDEPTMQQLQVRLESAMKSAVGLPSKVGCSRILVSLSTRHNVLFKPFSDHFLQLIEKYALDRNETVSSSYAAAAGYVARGASDNHILRMVTFAKKLYFGSEGDRDHTIPRRSIVAAEVMQAISKHASDRFNSLAADLIPFVFVGKHDSHDVVKELFQDTWNDNVGGSRAVSLYLKEILAMCVENLGSPQWAVKHTAARSIADATMAVASISSNMDATSAALLWPALERALDGKTWAGKEVVLYAFVKLVETGRTFWSAQPDVARAIEKESDSRTGGNPSDLPKAKGDLMNAPKKRKPKLIQPKECDWEFRWKFDDVTTNTQNKYVNVSTTGNAVWDPQAPRNHARSSPTPSYDDLPSFSELTNDEDRERKAELQMPGTYNVIVNPGSFSNLPEYGVTGTRARGASMNSGRSSFDSHSSSSEASRGRTAVDDPNIVVLTKFEDVSMSLPNIQAFSPNRRTSLPENMHRLEITISPRGSSLPSSRGDFGGNSARDERLMVHYKGFIAKRIMPLGKHFHLDTGAGREDPIVAEARNFPPLHHAICAISLLSLALKGQQQLLAESFQHYHQAIATSILSPSDLHSDRLLYLHFLLLVYDVCFGIQNLDGPNDGVNVNMWIQHIQHLLQIALHRQGHSTGDLQSYILWYVLSLDMNSSLVGSGSGGFVAAYLNNEINMADWRYIPVSKPGEQMHPNEDPSVYRAIYDFSSQVCKQCARISQLAISIRSGFSPQDFHGQNSPRRAARHAQIQVCANELYEIWNSKYPAFLPRAIAQAAAHLPHHARIVFEHTKSSETETQRLTEEETYGGEDSPRRRGEEEKRRRGEEEEEKDKDKDSSSLPFLVADINRAGDDWKSVCLHT
ncbi:hypothetical protein MBLNU459_g5782t2 [Dothideomycetes sp. NU459]